MSCGNLNWRSPPTGEDSTHELSFEDRMALGNTSQMRAFVDLLYRPRGLSRLSVDERDSMEGYAEELRAWFQRIEELGQRINAEARKAV